MLTRVGRLFLKVLLDPAKVAKASLILGIKIYLMYSEVASRKTPPTRPGLYCELILSTISDSAEFLRRDLVFMNWQHAPRQLQSLVRVGYATMALAAPAQAPYHRARPLATRGEPSF